MNRRTFNRSERGQSLVELAVVIVVLLIILAGVVDLGRMMFYYLSMRDAASEGAVYGAVYPTYCNQIRERVYTNLNDSSFNPNNISITVNGATCASAVAADACTGKQLIIVVDQPNFQMTMPLIGAFIGTQSVHLRAEVKETVVRPECPVGP